MLALQDCIGFSGLSPVQLEALAEHEHLNLMVAAELAECLLEQPGGCARLAHMIAEEIDHCFRCGRQARGRLYQQELAVFVVEHAA